MGSNRELLQQCFGQQQGPLRFGATMTLLYIGRSLTGKCKAKHHDVDRTGPLTNLYPDTLMCWKASAKLRHEVQTALWCVSPRVNDLVDLLEGFGAGSAESGDLILLVASCGCLGGAQGLLGRQAMGV